MASLSSRIWWESEDDDDLEYWMEVMKMKMKMKMKMILNLIYSIGILLKRITYNV